MTNHNETKENTLLHFSAQLRNWCLERFRHQPGPFRQVELTDQLISKTTIASPPVTLWVNRESFIAGAVILIPERNEEDCFPAGKEIATILGLPGFFTWGRHEIACWSTAYNPPEKEWSYDLPHDDISSPAAFRKSFSLLMGQAELFFYTHQKSIPAAHPLHLANLVNATYNDILPILQQAIQIENPEVKSGTYVPHQLKNLLLHQLLLPLALSANNQLPHTIPVETTSATLNKAALNLPGPLVHFHSVQEAMIPKDCLRRYNHFVSRIAQLGHGLTENLGEVATLLLARLAPELGGRPFNLANTDLHRIIINPDHCDLATPPAAEIAGKGVLSALALIRHAATPDQVAPQQMPDIMALKQKLPHHHIVGTLHEADIPQTEEHKKLNALLRISWPNHKITLPARTPVWVWQFLHLCGLIEKESRIELTLPKNWLWERYGEIIPTILHDKVRFTEIQSGNDNLLHCTLAPATDEVTTVVRWNDNGRVLPVNDANSLRSQILIALNMPEEIFNLLKTGELTFYSADQVESLSADGLNNYLKSTLGRHLWNLLAPGRPLPRNDKVAVECARIGLPLPVEKTISALGKLSSANSLSITDIDQELTVWLGTTSNLQHVPKQKGSVAKEVSDEDQLNKFQSACSEEEIPVFPENYLYNIPSAERDTFAFHGRLKVIDSFFNETILQDRKKQQITVHGTPQKEALLLLSTSRSGPVELPVDQQAMTEILARYIRDLKTLRQKYYRHAITFLSEEEVLNRVDDVWNNNSLPAWPLVKEG